MITSYVNGGHMGVGLENGVVEEGIHLIGIRNYYAQMMAQWIHTMYPFESRARWQPTNHTNANKHHHSNQCHHLHHLHHHHHLSLISFSLISLNDLFLCSLLSTHPFLRLHSIMCYLLFFFLSHVNVIRSKSRSNNKKGPCQQSKC